MDQVEITRIRQSISTRAPTGGATEGVVKYDFSHLISTRAPTGGATCAGVSVVHGIVFLLAPPREGRLSATFSILWAILNFYSRPHGRGDVRRRPLRPGRFHISTRAPTGGATWDELRPPKREIHFYSRPHGRGDPYRRRAYCCPPYFYSRPHGRGDVKPAV